jgi:hypothetical protein
MGSSFVRFGDKGFWARDGALEVWLIMLVKEIDSQHGPLAWILALREQWFVQATCGSVGCIATFLDDYATSGDRIDQLIALSEQAMFRLSQYGDSISKDDLNNLPHQEGSFWERDVEIDKFKRVGRCFLKLLRGELTSDPTNA